MKRFPKHYYNEIIELFDKNIPPTEVARTFRLNPSSVQVMARRLGYTFKKENIPSNYTEELMEFYLDGKTPKEISKLLKLNPVSVNSFFQKQGIKFRPDLGDTHYFSNIDNPIKAYFVGFIAADGYLVHNGGNSIVLGITINKKDIGILKKLKEEIGFEHKIQELTAKDQIRISISHPNFYQDLLNLGITKRKSLTLGNFIANIPKKFRKYSIIGYFDGDGSILKSGKTCRVISIRGTNSVLQAIAEELDLKQYKIAKYDATPRLTFGSTPEVKKFYNCYNGLDFYLKRKYDILHEKFDQAQTISSS